MYIYIYYRNILRFKDKVLVNIFDNSRSNLARDNEILDFTCFNFNNTKIAGEENSWSVLHLGIFVKYFFYNI